MNAIGIGMSRIRSIIMIEIIISCIIGIIIAAIISYFLTLYMQVSTFGVDGKYLYEYPLELLLCGIGSIMVIFCGVLLFVTKKFASDSIIASIKKDI